MGHTLRVQNDDGAEFVVERGVAVYSVSVARAGCKRKLQPRKRRFLCGNAWPIRKRPPHTRWPRNPTGVSAIRLRGWHWLRARSDRFRPENRYSAPKAHVTRDTSDSQESAETSNCSAGRPSRTARSRASARRDSNAGKSSFTGSSTPRIPGNST